MRSQPQLSNDKYTIIIIIVYNIHSSTSSVSESSIFSFVFVRHSYWLISIYKMNYHTDIVNFRELLLDRGAYLEILLFWRGTH